jgi:hypothetical protein
MFLSLEENNSTHQFPFIVSLIILCDFGDDDVRIVVRDARNWLEEDERKRGRRATGFFDCSDSLISNWSTSKSHSTYCALHNSVPRILRLARLLAPMVPTTP